MGVPSSSPTAPPAQASPGVAALQAARQQGAPPLQDGEQQNPVGTEKRTKEVFFSKDMLGDFKPKKGDKVQMTGTVTTTGIDIGVTPEKVGPIKGDKEEEDEFDPDLDDDLGDETQASSRPEPQL
jgi:hypothetical protein